MLILTPVIYFNDDCFREVIVDLVDSGVKRTIIIFSLPLRNEAIKICEYLSKKCINAEISSLCESDGNALSNILGQMKSFKPDCIIGLGGGHCMDISKVVRVLYEDPSTTLRSLATARDYSCNSTDFGDNDSTNNNNNNKRARRQSLHNRGSLIKKLLCIPTTCGSGCEVTPTAVMRNSDGKQVVVSGIALLPDIAIIDSNFISKMPLFIASITGMRALLHGIESYISKLSNTYSKCLSNESMSILFKYLKKSIVDRDVELLKYIHKSSCIAGMAISATDYGLGTVITRSISEVFAIPHGLIDSVVIKHVVGFNLKNSTETRNRISELSYKLGVCNENDTDEEKINMFMNELDSILNVLHLPRSLSEIGSSLLYYHENGWFDSIKGESSNLNSIQIIGKNKNDIISNINLSNYENSINRMVTRSINDYSILNNPVNIDQKQLSELFIDIWYGHFNLN
ncbi:NAD dependent dehydrogenase of possible bacterial origin [Cryptosporidium bovis]|uniref:NAD dependent dehydrogenase of possible bacterial origin n=1 Tax=Cryptosporidium bovis TaxID=310047 RepID=UPI00351A5431|nr:NAD dependent dehydrogenase of possible bacterial origin [Cryptosporidium bovis]